MGFVKSEQELDRYFDLGVRQFPGAKMMGVMYQTRAEIVSRLLPPPLEPAPVPSALIFIAEYPDTNLGPGYREGALMLSCTYQGEAGNKELVFYEDVEIPEEYMIFPPGGGYPMLHNAIITVGNLGVGYLAVGLMRAAYEEALRYSRERVQWGKPIIEHQLVAKKMLDIYAAIESSRALLWKASWKSKTQFPGDLKLSLTAKINATNLAVQHTAEMVQILAGYGISKEYPIEKYSRDAKLLPIMDGTNETLMLKAAALLD